MAAKKPVRVSPGMYRDASGNIVKASQLRKANKPRSTTPTATNGAGQNLDISDPNAVISAQQQENERAARESGQFNNPNIQGIGASRNITYDANGNPTVSVGLGSREQGLYDQAMSQYQQPFSFDGLPEIPKDFSADRQRVEDELYNREAGRLNDQYAREDDNFQQQMANRGIPMGSELYTKLRSDFERNKADAYSGARQNAIQTAGAEEQRMLGNALQGRQQGIGERQYQRDLAMNNLGSLMKLGMGVNSQMQGYQGQAINPTDIGGLSQGYFGLGQEAKLAQEQMKNNRRIAGGSGGDWRARMDAETQQRINLMDHQNMINQQNKPKQPGLGQAAAGIAGGFLGSFAGSAGKALGNSLFK